jgi:DNA-binding winged helix-turn-helix (wHTH) protein
MRYLFGDYCLDTQRYELRRGSMPIALRPRVYQVLTYLLKHHDRVVLKQELLEHVWPNQMVGDAALHSYIMDIRRAIGDGGNGQRLLRTIRGRGYRFISPVEVQDPACSSPIAPAATLPRVPAAASDTDVAPSTPYADGEYKLVTVLCGALAEAPALVARLGPESWYRLLQTVMELTQAVLLRYGGILTLATHDGFTVVFGVPVAQEDHARRAVLTALELRQHLRDVPDLRELLAGDGLSLSMGLDSGLVVVGELGQEPQRLATVPPSFSTRRGSSPNRSTPSSMP